MFSSIRRNLSKNPNLRVATHHATVRRAGGPSFASRLASSVAADSDVWTATDLHLSYSSPESDFVAANVSHAAERPTEWSHSLSFASPDSDFVAADVPHAVENQASQPAEWSHMFSFASPESDFVAADVANAPEKSVSPPAEWSHLLSFASPESDFAALNVPHAVNNPASPLGEWSDALSFASPDSDFVAANVSDAVNNPVMQEWSSSLSFASPDSDFVAANVPQAVENPVMREWSNSLSFVSPESDFVAANVTDRPLDSESSQTLSVASLESSFISQELPLHAPLPRTVEQALEDPRAIVITSARPPFRVEHVNEAWVGLCGYDAREAVGHSLGELLQGPRTDRRLVRSLVQQLRGARYAEGIVQNYAKGGREFRNFVRMSTIENDGTGEVESFVGVLHEIHESSGKKNHLMQG